MLPRHLAADAAGPVVVGVDGTDAAVQAAVWAAAVAETFQTPLLLVNAEPYFGNALSETIAGVRAAETVAQKECARATLDTAEAAVRQHFPALRISTTRAERPADEALTDLSRSARMIVLGCDELSFGRALLVGSTTVAVTAGAACPIVAWRGDLMPNNRSVVLGVDDERDNRPAIGAAFEFADRFGSGVIAVHAWSARRPTEDITLPFMIDWDEFENAERRHLSDAIAPWKERYPNVNVTSVIDPDRPGGALLRHAKDAQLFVVGSRGRGLLAGAVLGSTGLTLVHHSPVPVMICPSASD